MHARGMYKREPYGYGVVVILRPRPGDFSSMKPEESSDEPFSARPSQVCLNLGGFWFASHINIEWLHGGSVLGLTWQTPVGCITLKSRGQAVVAKRGKAAALH